MPFLWYSKAVVAISASFPRSTPLIDISLTEHFHANLIKEDWDNWRMHLLLRNWSLYRVRGKGAKHLANNQCLSTDVSPSLSPSLSCFLPSPLSFSSFFFLFLFLKATWSYLLMPVTNVTSQELCPFFVLIVSYMPLGSIFINDLAHFALPYWHSTFPLKGAILDSTGIINWFSMKPFILRSCMVISLSLG